MAYFFSPVGNSQQFSANGTPLSGGKINTYLAGSTTPVATYTSVTGATPQANPITLNTLGLPASPIWLNGGVAVKFVITDAANVVLQTIDNINGTNDTTTTPTEWVASGLVPTFISATSFSVPGDQTGVLRAKRRLRTSNTAGTIYSTINTATFAASVTTVTVTNDSGVLDSGITVVAYGLLDSQNQSIPTTVGRLVGIQTFTASGTYTRSAGVRDAVAEVVGGGGGGGGCALTSAGLIAAAGGGGGGGYAMKFISGVAASVAVTIGAGGAGTVGNGAGGAGVASSFGALVSASGGGGGGGSAAAAQAGAAGGSGGLGTVGDVLLVGTPGGGALAATATGALVILSGAGGSGARGGGGGPALVVTGTGQTGATFGGGGSGAAGYNSASAQGGGAGAAGVCVVYEYA